MKLVLRNIRMSFPDLFEAVQYQGTGPKNYRATFLIPEDSDTKKQVDAAVKQVASEKFGAKAGDVLKKAFATEKICWQDGNTKEYNGYEGTWFLVATRQESAGRPVIVDRQKNPLAAGDGKMYSGVFCNATVELWAQKNDFGSTVRATLVNVQFVRDGESFGGSLAATADDLDSLEFEDDEFDPEDDLA